MDKLLTILNEINPDIDYSTETALVDDGFIDSLDVMSIVIGITETMGVEIDPDDITAENFNSAAKIMQLIDKSR